MFEEIYRMFDRAKRLDPAKAWVFAVDNRDTKEEIIRLNTEDQLEEFGIDRDNVSLGDYAELTKMIKQEKGQRIDHVTLKDTGTFYDSFVVVVDKKGFTIIADDVAFYDRPLTDIYGLEILGLTKDNEEWLAEFIIDKYQEYAWSELRK